MCNPDRANGSGVPDFTFNLLNIYPPQSLRKQSKQEKLQKSVRNINNSAKLFKEREEGKNGRANVTYEAMSSRSSKRKHQNHMQRRRFQCHRFPVTLGLIHCFLSKTQKAGGTTLQSQKGGADGKGGLEGVLKRPCKVLTN